MTILQRATILFDAWRNRKNIEKAHSTMREVSIAKWFMLTGIQPKKGDYPLPPNYGTQLLLRLGWIDDFKKFMDMLPEKVRHTILIGDSLADFTRKELTSVDTRLNFAMAGQASSFYDAILRDTAKALEGIEVKYVIIECWGNELLSYFDLEDVKFHVARTINKARSMYPNAKLIIAGLPPVYDVYVNTVKVEFTKHLMNLVNQDANATLILLEKHFAGAFGLLPKIEYSVDGVHFSGDGIILFDKLLDQAKTTNEKVIGL